MPSLSPPPAAVHAFNGVPEHELADALQACVGVPEWAQAVLAGRPYLTVEALLAAADEAARAWDDAQVDRALSRHPRIGERASEPGREAALSAAEQSGIGSGEDVAARLRAGNAAYEQRFGRVFLIRAQGRSGEGVLAALEQRLTHDDATERAMTKDQLREITLLRLETLLGGLVAR